MLTALFRETADGVLLVGADGVIAQANPAACRMLAMVESAVVGARCADLAVAGEELHRILADGVLEGTARGELTFRRGDGGTVPVGVTVCRAASMEMPRTVLFRDLTEQRTYEAERQATQQALTVALARFDAFMAASPALAWKKDADGRYVYVNRAWEEASGFTRTAVIGHTDRDLVTPDLARARMRQDAQVLETGVPTVTEECVPAEGVRPARWYRCVTFRFVHGTGARFCGGLATDITAERQAQEALRESEARARAAHAEVEAAMEVIRRTEEKLRHAQKMEAVGRLAGGVAHDFNNLLTVILTNCEFLEERLRGDPEVTSVEEVVQAGRRAAALTRQLLAFSRKQVLEPRVLSLNTVVHGLESMLRRLLGDDIELMVLLASRLHRCRVDPGQMEQVIMNLVVNARDAMVQGGRLTLETANVVLDDGYVGTHPESQAGDYVMLSVSDTGAGMTPEVQSRLFEPFFTTKPLGVGTGLGLATVYGIVKQSGGTIWAYSEPGLGSTFKVYLPRTLAPEEALPVKVQALPRDGGRETLLLVEDHDQVRAAIRMMLTRVGYHVIEAHNGGEALLICEQYNGTIHLLLTDVVMPKLNGRLVAARLKKLRPDMKVVFMSGYTDNVVVHHGVLDSDVDFLQKPLTADVLLPRVREVLDRSSQE